ncbi:MAG: ABC transporter ATP-binding protein [Planctomycetota bacterium]
MIAVRKLRKSYGVTRPAPALRGVSFDLPARGVTGLLGPNGAGKSTTIRILTGFIRPDDGSVTLAGIDALADPQTARFRLGYLPESAPLYPELTAERYLRYRAGLFGLRGRRARDAAAAAADRCRLGPLRARRIGALSKGYRQRVGLAAAILHDPPVVILDEPASGLDPAQIRETRSMIRELGESRTVLVSSHLLSEVEAGCDRALVLTQGRLVADGSPRELISEHATGPAALLVEASGPGEPTWAVTLRGIARVVSEPRGNRRWSIRLEPSSTEQAAGSPLADRAARAVHDAGWSLHAVTPESPTLEEVFIGLLRNAEPKSERGAGPVGGDA